ncbi:FeoB small GTPase domain-containing protein [Belliella kenyensis]|uniref:FeoB small GTPase domain-containing protein n=1 Tax=Belliella kenyensis TaxID=1472724 RepID=UPI00338F8667
MNETIKSKKDIFSIALIGNPNVGKSSIFNQLTGLNQKIGNYPGLTVDKASGFLKDSHRKYELVDLPGTYSLYPKSEDELIAYKMLSGKQTAIDAVIVVLDACNLERSLLLGTQVMDFGLPVAFVLNMKDLAEKQGLIIKTHELYKSLGVPLALTDARKVEGLEAVKTLMKAERFAVTPLLSR